MLQSFLVFLLLQLYSSTKINEMKAARVKVCIIFQMAHDFLKRDNHIGGCQHHHLAASI